MRKLSLALMVSICFLGISSAAGATSVSLIWQNWAGGPIDSISGDRSSVTINQSAVATLTLDVVLDIDSRGVAGVFLSIDFDTDLGNEVNILSWQEFTWSRVNKKGITSHLLLPLSPGIESTIESTGNQAGSVFEFDGASLGSGPVNTTLTFARLVFSTNHGLVRSDGKDIFADIGATLGGNEGGSNITNSVTFTNASVNIVPEPGTVMLLGLGVGALALAGRRRGRK